MKLIDKHFEWMEKSEIECFGLCNSLPLGNRYSNSLYLFMPTESEFKKLESNGYNTLFWASGLKTDDSYTARKYTELRQNIVLLICAMHDEL